MIPLTPHLLHKQNIRNLLHANTAENNNAICMEECAELIQAISKMQRYWLDSDDGIKAKMNLVEEIADVIICIDLLKEMYCIGNTTLETMIDAKMDRNLRRIEENENE